MPSTPSEAGRAGLGTEGPDRPGSSAGDLPPPARTAEPTPTLVLRPRALSWTPGPALLVLAALLVVSGRRWGVALVPFAIACAPVAWVRIEVGEATIRRRALRGTWRRVPLDSVTALRLRRLPFHGFGWLRRGYRLGRFWTVPLTVRLLGGDDVLLELRCVWWSGWRQLARYVATRPEVDLDPRTRGRLDRYVGPLVVETSAQP